MPPKVKVVAINGDIELRGDAGITQLPSTEGQLDLLANGSITFLNANNSQAAGFASFVTTQYFQPDNRQ